MLYFHFFARNISNPVAKINDCLIRPYVVGFTIKLVGILTDFFYRFCLHKIILGEISVQLRLPKN